MKNISFGTHSSNWRRTCSPYVCGPYISCSSLNGTFFHSNNLQHIVWDYHKRFSRWPNYFLTGGPHNIVFKGNVLLLPHKWPLIRGIWIISIVLHIYSNIIVFFTNLFICFSSKCGIWQILCSEICMCLTVSICGSYSFPHHWVHKLI